MEIIETRSRNSFLAKQLAQSSESDNYLRSLKAGLEGLCLKVDSIRKETKHELWTNVVFKARRMLFLAKYLIVEEKCRKCERIIHPNIPLIETDKYSPPGEYWIRDRQFHSDILCADCCDVISVADVIKSTVDVDCENRYCMTIKVYSGTKFEGTIKKLIYRFKFDGDLGLLDDLRLLIWKAWHSYVLENNAEIERPILVPVPLHWWRLRTRGFNQSELLAFGLGKLLKVKVARNALSRTRRTKTQHELPKTNRLENVRNAFKANSRAVAGKSVILIDDVCTSGATISECARALFEAGATSVTALTLAKVPLSR